MSAPPLTPPPRPEVIPSRCEALRDNTKCGDNARLFAGGWRCPVCAPSSPPLPPTQAA